MIYIDTSCLIKLLRPEDNSEAVALAVAEEDHIVVSPLTEIEALVQLKARFLAGDYSLALLRQREARLGLLRNQEPFHFKTVSHNLWQIALRQHRNSRDLHCRTLDRLHLAAMEGFGILRLMTDDHGQAEAARDLRFEVVEPGR